MAAESGACGLTRPWTYRSIELTELSHELASVQERRRIVGHLGRWHTPGSTTGWHLVERTDAALAENSAKWADVLELEVTPVIEDDVAATVGKKVHGK